MDRRTFLTSVASVSTAGLLSSCGSSEKHTIRLALDWKPEPEFGGFYAAPFEKHELNVEILPGGSGTPTVQMIGAGSAEFGIVAADELVIARSRGNDVVALFAVYQNCPQGIMAHASRKLKSIGEVFESGTVAMQRGLPYARILEKKFGFGKVKIVPSPNGDISTFLHDEKFAQQCFVTAEPLAAKRAGVDVTVFPVADSGYNPYTTVLAASGKVVREQAEMVRNMVSALREGWQFYLAAPGATNEQMHGLNPSMDAATFAEVAMAQKPYIVAGGDLGGMTAARWEVLIGQLKELGDIAQAIPAAECFRALSA